jgi:hypothetical protein
MKVSHLLSRVLRFGVASAALIALSILPCLAQEKKVEEDVKKLGQPKVRANDERSVVICPDKELVRETLKSISRSAPRIQPTDGSLPPDCAVVSLPTPPTVHMGFGQTRGWPQEEYTWTAPGLGHKPIYFEDLPLERYGQARGPLVQPLVSHARFFGVLPTLPYRMALDPPNVPICTVGYDRPGNCVPYVRERLPFSPRAAVAQTATVAGLILLIP